MAGTGGTTSYSPISLLTGTALLPPKPPTVVAKPSTTSQPVGLANPVIKPVVKPSTSSSSSSSSGSSGSASSASSGSSGTKKPTNTLSEMMGGSSGSSTPTKKTTTPLSSITSSTGQPVAMMPKAAPVVAPAADPKAALAKAYMAALAASVKNGGAGAIPAPNGLTSDEVNKYRSQFFTNYYANQPVQQIVEPMNMAQAAQAYDINKRIDPQLLGYLNSGFQQPAPAPQAPQFINTVPMDMGLGYAQTPAGGMPGVTQGVRPAGPASGLPGVAAYGPGVVPGPMPQMDYVAPGNQQITFTPQAVRPGVPSGMPAAPFIPQAVRPGVPSGMPAAPAPTIGAIGAERGIPAALIRDRFPNAPADQLNARGIANRILDYVTPQRAASETGGGDFDIMNLLIGQAKGDEYIPENVDPSKVAPVPYPRPVSQATTTMPIDQLMADAQKRAGMLAGMMPKDPSVVAEEMNKRLAGIGYYDPKTGQVTVNDPYGTAAQDKLKQLMNPGFGDVAGGIARDVIKPYIDQATVTRTPIPAGRPVPADMTRPIQTLDQIMGGSTSTTRSAPEGISTRPVVTVSVDEQGNVVPARRADGGAFAEQVANASRAAQQQRNATDALIAGGQAAASTVPANRQGLYGALDYTLSGQAGADAQAKRLAAGVDPNNLMDNISYSLGMWKPPAIPAPPAAAPMSTPNVSLQQEVAALNNVAPDNSLRQSQAVTQDMIAGLGVTPADPFVKKYGNVPTILGSKNTDGSRRVFAGGKTEEPLGTLAATGEFTPSSQPARPERTASAGTSSPNTTSEAVGSGPEGDGSYMPSQPGQTAPSNGFEARVTSAAGANRTPTGAKRYTPADNQMVGTNGYIYEVTGTDAQGKPIYKNVGKVPGYTDAQLYKAANAGAFRDPSNIPQGGTTPKPPSALRTWARSQLDKYNAEVAKKTAEAKAKGETYNPVSFMDYLSLAGSAATGNVAGMLLKGGQMIYPQIIDWLANGPSSTGDSTMMDGSPSTSSKSNSATTTSGGKKGKRGKKDTDTGGTSTTTGTSGYAPTGGSLSTGYTMKDFPYLLPYLTAAFPPSTYRPGIDPEWNYYPGSQKAYATGGAVQTPRLVLGQGGPTEDKIPAKIDGVHEAKLSNGEFVITAAAVKGIGGGDMQRGAAELMKLNDMFAHRPDSGRLNVEKVR